MTFIIIYVIAVVINFVWIIYHWNIVKNTRFQYESTLNNKLLEIVFYMFGSFVPLINIFLGLVSVGMFLHSYLKTKCKKPIEVEE